MSTELTLEEQIIAKGLIAPRITPEYLNTLIKKIDFHVFPDTCLTVCCLTLKNGYTVSGTSACASPENFNQQIGQDIAYANARQEIWALEGYLLKQRLYEGQETSV